MDKTSIYSVEELTLELMLIEIKEVVSALKEKGYNPVNQIAGYLLTGDNSYITSHGGARQKICKYKKNEVLAFVLEGYLKGL